MKVLFRRIHENAQIPKQATELAGGWDVVATEIIKEADDFYICKLGFALTPPNNYKITIVPRSSLTKTHWILQNSPCLGDPDFSGEYQLRFRGMPTGFQPSVLLGIVGRETFSTHSSVFYEPFPFSVGDRIGQLYLEEIIPIEFEEVNELYETKRGIEGFGSTGLK